MAAEPVANLPPPPLAHSNSPRYRDWATYLYIVLGLTSWVSWVPFFYGLWYGLDTAAPPSEDDNQFGPYGAAIWGGLALFLFFIPLGINFLVLAAVREYRALKPLCFFVPTFPGLLIGIPAAEGLPWPGKLVAALLTFFLVAEVLVSVWWLGVRRRVDPGGAEFPTPDSD